MDFVDQEIQLVAREFLLVEELHRDVLHELQEHPYMDQNPAGELVDFRPVEEIERDG